MTALLTVAILRSQWEILATLYLPGTVLQSHHECALSERGTRPNVILNASNQ